jgi:ribosomal protein S12 methylthiotransferase
LKEFIQEFEFDSLGIFPYSREPGTVAAAMPNQLPDHVIRDRVEELTAHQEAIAFGARSRFEGKVLPILIDRAVESDDGGFEGCDWAGRFYGQGLDVDGEVYLSSKRALTVGEFVDARIVDAGTFDLKAEVL